MLETGPSPLKKRKNKIFFGFRASCLFLLILLSGCTGICVSVNPLSPREEKAYEHNRKGMINMSKAFFDEAIVEYKKAYGLVYDYQIRNQSLIYTPIFMTAWAYEKIGEVLTACQYYKQFLKVASDKFIEKTKASHAREYIKRCMN